VIDRIYEVVRQVWDQGVGLRPWWARGEKDDAVQAAVLRCWQYAAKHDPARGPAEAYWAWLARFEFTQHAMRKRNRRIGGRPLRFHHAIVEGEPVVAAAALAEELAELRMALGTMPGVEGWLLRLYRGEKLDRVGKDLGISRQAVHQRREFALRILRDRMIA